MNFNQPEGEFLDGDDVVGLGVLGKEGSGRLRIQARPRSGSPALSRTALPSWCCPAGDPAARPLLKLVLRHAHVNHRRHSMRKSYARTANNAFRVAGVWSSTHPFV